MIKYFLIFYLGTALAAIPIYYYLDPVLKGQQKAVKILCSIMFAAIWPMEFTVKRG